MGGSSGKSSKKAAEPAAPSVATNPNYIAMQQPQPFAPGMQDMLANQLGAGFGSPAGLLGSSSATDFNGLLNSIYNPATPAQAADPIGAAIAAAKKPAAKPAATATPPIIDGTTADVGYSRSTGNR